MKTIIYLVSKREFCVPLRDTQEDFLDLKKKEHIPKWRLILKIWYSNSSKLFIFIMREQFQDSRIAQRWNMRENDEFLVRADAQYNDAREQNPDQEEDVDLYGVDWEYDRLYPNRQVLNPDNRIPLETAFPSIPRFDPHPEALNEIANNINCDPNRNDGNDGITTLRHVLNVLRQYEE